MSEAMRGISVAAMLMPEPVTEDWLTKLGGKIEPCDSHVWFSTEPLTPGANRLHVGFEGGEGLWQVVLAQDRSDGDHVEPKMDAVVLTQLPGDMTRGEAVLLLSILKCNCQWEKL